MGIDALLKRREREKAIFDDQYDRQYVSVAQRLKIACTPRYSKFLKSYGKLPAGFWVIEGEQGIGKTSAGTALLNLDYKYHNRRRLAAAQRKVDELNEYRDEKLELPEHLYYSNIRQYLNKSQTAQTHFINAEDLQIPNEQFSKQHYPFGSVIYFQEADKDFNCLDSKKIGKFVTQLMKFCRHNDMTIIFDLQVFNRLSATLRYLITNRVHIQCKYEVGHFGRMIKNHRHRLNSDVEFKSSKPVKKTVWYFSMLQNQSLDRYKEMKVAGIDVDTSFAFRNWTLVYKGNIFNQYESRSAIMLFWYGLKKYETKEHIGTEPTAENIELFYRENNRKPDKSREKTNNQ